MHRLNRFEYNNTVRDLLDVDFDAQPLAQRAGWWANAAPAASQLRQLGRHLLRALANRFARRHLNKLVTARARRLEQLPKQSSNGCLASALEKKRVQRRRCD